MKTEIRLPMKVYIHMVDALNAARMAGLKSETEQLAFDESINHAGGIMKLIERTELHRTDGRVFR